MFPHYLFGFFHYRLSGQIISGVNLNTNTFFLVGLAFLGGIVAVIMEVTDGKQEGWNIF